MQEKTIEYSNDRMEDEDEEEEQENQNYDDDDNENDEIEEEKQPPAESNLEQYSKSSSRSTILS